MISNADELWWEKSVPWFGVAVGVVLAAVLFGCSP